MVLNTLLAVLPEAVVHGEDRDRQIEHLVYDSRKMDEGAASMFFCLPGSRVDGHIYAPAMVEKGCCVFVCDHVMALPDDVVQIVVDDPRLALAKLSAAFWDYPAKKLSIIGITGTKGKTSVAQLFCGILNENGIRCAYIGTNGIQIGTAHYETVNSTPESDVLQRYFRKMVDEGYTHVVMEVSSQALKGCRVYGLSFDTCLFTNLGEDHISAVEHPDLADYRACKRRLFFDYPVGHIVTNIDDPQWQVVSGNPHVPTITYAIDDPLADFTAEDIAPYRTETALGIAYTCRVPDGTSIPVKQRTPGTFSVYNGLCAMAAASIYGITPGQAATALAKISMPGRFEMVDVLPGVTFLIDYAHNGMSLEHALTELRRYQPHRLICLFGSIGGRAQNRRRELAEVSSKLADISILTSDNPDREPPEDILQDILSWFDRTKPHYVFPDRAEAVRAAVHMAEKGDIVLLAGKGHEDYQLIDGQKVHFSEREILMQEAKAMDRIG